MSSSEEILSEIVRRAAHYPRTGWAIRGIRPIESVGEHCFMASCIGILICDIENLSHHEIVPILSFHDFGELIIGDINIELYPLIERKNELEAAALCDLLKPIPKLNYYINELISYINGNHPLGKVIKNIDRLATLHQAFEYEAVGWRDLDLFWKNLHVDLSGYAKVLADAMFLSRSQKNLGTSLANESVIDDYYQSDSYADVFREVVSRFPQSIFPQLFQEFFAQMDYDVSGKNILDVGAGTGRFSDWFKLQRDCRVTCVDINSRLLSEIPEQNNLKKVNWNINNIPWPFLNSSFDIVLCGEVLEHLFRPDNILREIKRLLKKDGLLFISVPDTNHPSRKLNILKYGHPEMPERRRLWEEHIQFYTAQTLIKGVSESWFRPIKMCWHDLQKERTPFMDLSQVQSLDNKKIKRHIFMVAQKEKAHIEANDSLDLINVPVLLDILRILNRAKFVYSDVDNQTIAEKYLHELCLVPFEKDKNGYDDRYRFLLVSSLIECYLAGVNKKIRDDIKNIPRITKLLSSLSLFSEEISSKYLRYTEGIR